MIALGGAAPAPCHHQHAARPADDHDEPGERPSARVGGRRHQSRCWSRNAEPVGKTWLYFLNATPFGKTDPILGHDIGFYVFTLPLLEMIQGIVYLVLFLMAACRIAAYVCGRSRTRRGTRCVSVAARAGRHLGLLAGGGLLAWRRRLAANPQLLTATSGVVTGATYADVNARIPRCGRLSAPHSAGRLAVLQASRGDRLWPIGAAVSRSTWPVSLGGSAYAAIINVSCRAQRAGAARRRYRPQHQRNAPRSSRRRHRAAIVRGSQPDARGSRAQRGDHRQRSLWNDRPLRDTFSQIQEIRTYYDLSRWTTTATRSTASTARSCCRRAS